VSGRLVLFLGLYLLLGGLCSLAGWVFDLPRLTDWDGNGISIQPNATLCVLLSGMALVGLTASWRRVARLAGASVLLIGGSTLLQWLAGISFGIDELLLFSREWGRVGVVFPGRMGPPGSLSWTLIGTALILTTAQGSARRIAPVLCAVTAAISFLSLTGYLYGVDPLYSLPYSTVIALQTATFVLAASIGVIAAHPNSEPLLTLRDQGSAGSLARRALPIIILLPLALGYLRLRGQAAGFYGTSMGVALSVLAFIGITGMVVWRALREVRMATQEQIRQRDFLERLIESSPIAIAVVQGPELRFVMMNSTYRSIVGPAKRPAVGATFADVFPEAAALGGAEKLRQVIATGEPWKVRDFHMPMGNRADTWWEGEVLSLTDADGVQDSALILTWDISERKQAEKIIAESERELRESSRRKDEFLATLAHELRNPLAPVRNALHVLRMKGASALPWAQAIAERQVEHLVRLIDDLMDVSRISQGKLALKREPVELAKILDAAVDAARPQFEERRHSLTVDLPDRPVYLDADVTRLVQVFGNLLNNACRYTEPGGRISLSARADGDEVAVTIGDNGIGIPPNRLRDIFEPFVQVDTSLERAHGGLGVGLALVKRLVELHGGRVEAESAGPGQGSSFTVRVAKLPDIKPVAAGSAVTPLTPGTSHRVLVVDDNRDAAESLAVLLRMTGNAVRTAYAGADALGIADEFHPSIVLLDIGMPELSGYDVARAIRSTPWGQAAVLIAVTGWGQTSDRSRAREAGFDHHLVKPVAPEAILAILAVTPSSAAQATSP
jgi:PAS domain S-box-containing protein